MTTQEEATVAVEIPKAEQPILVTSSGQSADVQMLKAVLTNLEFDFDFNPTVEADAIEKYKTIIFVIGGSSKGLGAAGIKPEEEIARTERILDAAADATILGVHIGGESRRGGLSDSFANVVAPNADYMIVVEGGDDDGYFTEIALENGIPLVLSENIAAVGAPIIEAFK
ncbi:hypothetical protein DWB64_01515 [Fusibacter sp. A1]|nr:hypothetical protein [Fusibacter sp. A1]RXV63782.1 hypothetical protein DWB64_01515 [Fusibacter sp. A1]